MKSKTLSTIANLLSSLQKRITKTSAVAHQNAGSILILADKQKEVEAAVEVFRAQSFQRSDAIALSLVQVKEENDRRETHQTLRDQNNVQALVNLKDSTQKAFDQVKTDVKNLMVSDERATQRLNRLEFFMNDLMERAKSVVMTPAPQPSMPSDHVWVNKKLTGVYDTTTDLENRVKKLEEENTKLKSLPLAVRTFGVDTFMGHDVKFVNDKLYVGQEVFPFVEDITNVIHQRGQLLIICRGGDIYVFAGGPNVNTMFVYQHSRA